MATGDSWAALRRKLVSDLFAARRGQARGQLIDFEVGTQGDLQRRLPRAQHRVAQLRRQRIDRAAFDAGAGDHGVAAHRVRPERQRDALERLALEAVAEDIGPGDVKPQLAGRSAMTSTPWTVRISTQPPSDPAAASLRRQARGRSRRVDGASPSACSKAGRRYRPSRSSRWRNANSTPAGVEPSQPGAQQRRGLERFRKHAPACRQRSADPAPRSSADDVRRERLDRGCRLRRVAVARQEWRHGSLWVRFRPPRPAIRNLRPADGIAS